MTRISLKEAYDNRDIIAWLVKNSDAIQELQAILKDLDPNGDLTNVVTKTGDQTIDGIKTFIGKIVTDCDIIQNGAAYETHAEQIYSHNDYLVMRDGALNALPAGSYSGLQVKKYNGSDDVRMVVDNTGIMRVGDVNDERPLLVRDEAADLSSGDVLLWDSVNQKAIGQAKDTAPTAGSTAPVTSDGILTALNSKQDTLSSTITNVNANVNIMRYGKIIIVSVFNVSLVNANDQLIASGLPAPLDEIKSVLTNQSGQVCAIAKLSTAGTLTANAAGTMTVYGSFSYLIA